MVDADIAAVVQLVILIRRNNHHLVQLLIMVEVVRVPILAVKAVAVLAKEFAAKRLGMWGQWIIKLKPFALRKRSAPPQGERVVKLMTCQHRHKFIHRCFG